MYSPHTPCAALSRLRHGSQRMLVARVFSTSVSSYQKDKKSVSAQYEFKEISDTDLKKKWTWSRLKTLREWNEDTFYVFGPKLKPSTHRVAPSGSFKSSPTRSDFDFKSDYNKAPVTLVGNTSLSDNSNRIGNSVTCSEESNLYDKEFLVSNDDITTMNNIMQGISTDSEVNTVKNTAGSLNSSASKPLISSKEQSRETTQAYSSAGKSKRGIKSQVAETQNSSQLDIASPAGSSRNEERIDYEDVSSSDDETGLNSSSINPDRAPVAVKGVSIVDNLDRVSLDGNVRDKAEDAVVKAFLGTILHYPLFSSIDSNETEMFAFDEKRLVQEQSRMPLKSTSEGILQKAPANFNSGIGDSFDNNGSEVRKLSALKLPPILSSHCPSVSTILSTTMPPENRLALDRWERQMIQELGEEGFAQHKKETLLVGSNLHASVQRHLDGQSLELDPRNEGHWKSLQSSLSVVDETECQEFSVRHSVLNYRGILDCVALYGGVRSLIEWKTSKKARRDIRYTYDNPLQLAAYLGAYNTTHTSQQIHQCVLVIGHEDGTPADVHIIPRADCVQHWRHWLRRLHLYWIQKTNIS